MKIEITKALRPDGAAHAYDVMQAKKALNRLGYYVPYEKVGITGIPDQRMFDAIRSFQRMNNLRESGEMSPGDETERMINLLLEGTPPGHYIWRTVEDGKVRNAHAQYNRTVRSWSDSPDPGEDFGCRCWAELVQEGYFLPPRGLKLEESHTNYCDQIKDKLLETQKKVRDLSEHLNTIFLEINVLIEQNNALIESTSKTLGARLVAYLLTLPFERLGGLGDLLTRYFESIISNELIEGSKNFMNQRKARVHKTNYKKEQLAIVFAQLEKQAENLEELKKKYELCKL